MIWYGMIWYDMEQNKHYPSVAPWTYPEQSFGLESDVSEVANPSLPPCPWGVNYLQWGILFVWTAEIWH